MFTVPASPFYNDDTLPDSGNATDARIMDELVMILSHKQIRVVFQPIVAFADATVIGYEALSRGPEGSVLEFPDALFSAATKFSLIWELEYLCRAKALEKARFIGKKKSIFINVDPNIINDIRFQKGLTKEILHEHHIDASNVIFELTEKTAIQDYRNFRKMLENYTSQGYKIAIDDTGSGYSGLKMLAQTYPHYIKVDMELVRNIDKDPLKQAMMKALHDFSVHTNSRIIAEGIETPEELAALIAIGIPYGQGFFLQRPSPEFLDISPQVRQSILACNQQQKSEIFPMDLATAIGKITRQHQFFPPTALILPTMAYFNANPGILGMPIVDNRQPVGLLMRNKFLNHPAVRSGAPDPRIDLVMDHNPLIVDYGTPLAVVVKSALTRVDENVYDYIIVAKEGKYFGITTIKDLLAKTTRMEAGRVSHSRQLPG